MKLHVAALLCASVLVASCASTKHISKEASVLVQTDLDFAKATAERGVEGWVSYFDEHGSQMKKNGEWVTGHDAIRANMKPAFDDPNFSLIWQPADARMSKAGHLGYTWGRYRLETKTKDGKPVSQEGNYITVWKQQSDGSWKVLFDTGEAD